MNTTKLIHFALAFALSFAGVDAQIVRRHSSSGVATRGGSLTSFDVSSTPQVNVISQGGTSTVTVQDEIRNQVTTATIDTEATVTDTVPLTLFKEVANLTPSIASFDSTTGRFTRIADGTASLTVKSGTLRKRLNLSISRLAGQTVTTHSSFVSGSLTRHILDNVQNQISGLTANTTTLNVFSSIDHTTASYTRNASLWCSGYASKLTGFSAWNSNGGQTQAGTLITPRHIVFANHFIIPDGGTVRFVTTSGTAVDRTLSKSKRVGTTDTRIGVLNSDLPATITPLSVLPSTWGNHIKNIASGIPCVSRNQFGELRIVDISILNTSSAIYKTSLPASRSNWYRAAVAGDSGSGQAFMINGTLALLSTWHYSSLGPAYHAIDYSTEIPALDTLAGVSTGYLPTVIDLSTFPTY